MDTQTGGAGETPVPSNDYDAIVIGGGHNGLISGAYFARAGARTRTRAAKIVSENGRARGVVLENGDELRAPVVVTILHPKLSFLEMLERK